MPRFRPLLANWRDLPGAVPSRILAAILLLLGCSTAVRGGESADVLTPAEREQFFQAYFERMNAPKPLTRFKTRAQWLSYRNELKRKILRATGLAPLPDRVPLSPVTTGKLEREDYTVERVYYQVFPKVYASGYLYRPKQRPAADGTASAPSRRLPAVLNPHGHWVLGALDPTVQARCIALAKMEYVAFCPDSTHVTDLGVGLCPIGLMTWNNMRALDYLESLDFVDGTRLGCTGESGGGQQTLYLAALDERVKVIVPAVLVSYFRRILFASEETHCYCNHAPGIARLTDETEMAAMFAPRPARFICATGDWTRDFPKEEFPEIQHIYRLVGGEVDCVQFDKPHNYDRDSREQMYPWMNAYLKSENPTRPVREPPVTTEPPETLKALSGPLPDGSDLEGARAWYRSNYLSRPAHPERKRQWQSLQTQTRARLREVLGMSDAPEKIAAASKGTTELQGLELEKLVFATAPGVGVPAWFFPARTQRQRHPAVVLVHAKGKQSLLGEQAELVRQLVRRGIAVLAIDPRFRGELQRKWHWNAVIWGTPEEGLAAHDLNCAGAYLRSRKDVEPKEMFLIGFGDAGRFALFAGALDPHWAGVAMEQAGPLYAEGDPKEVAPGLLRCGDLPEFAALMAPRPLWVHGIAPQFGLTKNCYEAFGQSRSLRLSSSGDFAGQLPDWITRPKAEPAGSLRKP